jgi:hypothetical protein
VSSQVRDFRASQIQDSKSSQVRDFRASRIQDSRSSQVRDFRASQIQDSRSSQVRDFRASRIQDSRSSRSQLPWKLIAWISSNSMFRGWHVFPEFPNREQTIFVSSGRTPHLLNRAERSKILISRSKQFGDIQKYLWMKTFDDSDPLFVCFARCTSIQLYF